MKRGQNEMHVLTGSYAVNALDGAELAAFERHLTRCVSCATEVRGLRETAARLAMAASRPAPARLHDRVAAATYRTRQLPPAPDRHKQDGRGRRWITWPRVSVAAAVLSTAAAAVLAVVLVITSGQLSATRAANSAVAAVLAAPDARIATARTTAGATMTVVASSAEGEAVITTAGMASLPDARVYQAWVMNSAGARSLGLLRAAPGDRTQPVLADRIRPGEKIGITVEPAGGTTQPTSTPLITMTLPA